MDRHLRFGVFLPPFHKSGVSPSLAFQDDLDLLQWLDTCGFDEAWCGEHHSAGMEIIASPEIFIAMAAERTRRIKLGTGVISLPYHNPLWVAERIVMLDHLTRGRVMLGCGPGALATDAAMVGIAPRDSRRFLEEGMAIVMQLLTSEKPVTFKNERWDLRDAQLHLRPYSNPLFDVAVTAIASPNGPRLAGKHGLGLLSIGATTAAGFDALAMHWDVLTGEAKHHGRNVDRSKWRLVALVHCAETEAQARRDVEYGIEQFFFYLNEVSSGTTLNMPGKNAKEMIDFVNGSGLGVIGTPEQCASLIDRLWIQSDGGFGSFLMMTHGWADRQATRLSHELVARHVFPEFQGHAAAGRAAETRARAARPEFRDVQSAALTAAKERHATDLETRLMGSGTNLRAAS